MVEVVLVGNGAREHAIAKALVKGGAKLKAFMSARNPGIAKLCNENIKISKLNNFSDLLEFAKNADFVVVGPEAPLVIGITNALKAANISCVGPSIEVAQLEGSKIFTRSLLEKYKIQSNVQFKAFESMEGIEEWVNTLGIENVVVKPDGLTGGKGVKVYGEHLHSLKDITDYCHEILGSLGFFIIEEKLNGEEFTLQTFVDGEHVVATPIVQDHKRAYEEDKGPNTGGMGSYSMADHLMPFITQDDVDQALDDMLLTIKAIKAETGTGYKGFLYGQFMKTKKGIKLVEFNVRFGDPEAMNVLSILEDNFVDICRGIIAGTLDKKLKFKNVATVCKYLVPDGYPTDPKENEVIEVDEEKLESLGLDYYYASVNEEKGAVYTSRSRTMGLLGIGETLDEAEKKVEQGTQFVKGNLFHRKDIGTKNLLQKRIEHMENILK